MENLQRARVNGIPIWLAKLDVSGGERTVLKEAPHINGARVETQGQLPVTYTLDFNLFRDGTHQTEAVDTASINLRGMLALGGPFELELPRHDGISETIPGLWLTSPWRVTIWDGSITSIQSGQLTLTDAQPFPAIEEDARAVVVSEIKLLARAAIEEFERRAPALGFDPEAVECIGRATAMLADIRGKVLTPLGPVTALSSQIDALKAGYEQILTVPFAFAQAFYSTAMQVVSLVPALGTSGTSAVGGDIDSDAPKDLLVDVATAGAGFDDGSAPVAEALGDAASAEDTASAEQVYIARDLVWSAMLCAVCYAAVETQFTTADAVVEAAVALQDLAAKLLDSPTVDYRAAAAGRSAWLSTVRHLAEVAAGLPRLVDYTVPSDIDALSLVAELAEPGTIVDASSLEREIDRFLRINAIPDPLRIRAGIVVRILQGPA